MMIINMNKSERQKVYQMFDWHWAYCGKPIRYDEMQVDHVVAKNRGLYPHFDASQGRFVVEQGADALANYMPSCRACNFRKGSMSLEQFRQAIVEQARGLVRGSAKFQVNMSLAYGLIEEHFDRPVRFYFETIINKRS